jgi:IS4 transposase
VKPRIYYAYSESREVHSVGKVLLVFSTREKPQPGQKPKVQKILLTNDRSLSAAAVVELYDLRWQIELFFKELKSTLGFDQYRFRRFEQVEGWLEMTLVAFLYLEWHRARQLSRSSFSKEQKERWRYQRTHGLCVAMRRQTEQEDLEYLTNALQTKGGIRRLRRQLDEATQTEYRMAS